MPRIEEPGQDVERVAGRGREETAPIYLQFGVVTAVTVFVLLVIGLVVLAMWLAG